MCIIYLRSVNGRTADAGDDYLSDIVILQYQLFLWLKIDFLKLPFLLVCNFYNTYLVFLFVFRRVKEKKGWQSWALRRVAALRRWQQSLTTGGVKGACEGCCCPVSSGWAAARCGGPRVARESRYLASVELQCTRDHLTDVSEWPLCCLLPGLSSGSGRGRRACVRYSAGHDDLLLWFCIVCCHWCTWLTSVNLGNECIVTVCSVITFARCIIFVVCAVQW